MTQITNRQKVPQGATPIDPHGGDMWNPPGVTERAKAQLPAGTGFETLCSAIGDWANYEVWADVPNSWQAATLTLELGTGPVVVELDRARPIDMQRLTTIGPNAGILGRPAEPGRLRGLLFSCYGRPGYGQLLVRGEKGAALLSDGVFWIRTWGTEGAAVGDRVGRPILDRWGTRHQQLSFTRRLLADETEAVIVPIQAQNAAFHITDFIAVPRTTDTNPLELHLREPVTPINNTPVISVPPASLAPVVVDLSFPWTGLRGYQWVISRAGAVIWDVTVNGYVE